jgi:hypothetical protein
LERELQRLKATEVQIIGAPKDELAEEVPLEDGKFPLKIIRRKRDSEQLGLTTDLRTNDLIEIPLPAPGKTVYCFFTHIISS